MKALDVEAVRAFVLVADLNSFTRAAEALDTTQSAVSLKIKRLEDGPDESDCPQRAPPSLAQRAILSPRINRRSEHLPSNTVG